MLRPCLLHVVWFAIAYVYMGIAGIFGFGSLMVSFQSPEAAFMFGKTHDGVLWNRCLPPLDFVVLK